MKILQLRSSIGYFGAESMLLELSKYLLKNDVQVIIGIINNLYNKHLELCEIASKNKIQCKLFDCRSQIDFATIRAIRNFIMTQLC